MKFYHDKDANLKDIKDETVAVVGYGIEGRAQALNLRDSSFDVVVGNRDDDYTRTAIKDGQQVMSIEDAVGKSSIAMMLIPDQAHAAVYDSIESKLNEGDMIVVAHGYSLHFKQMKPRSDLDVVMLAPRMPGGPIRDAYLDGKGVPAFFDVYQNATGRAKERGLALAKAIGFTRAGVAEVSVAHETEMDLFMEQYFVAGIIQLMANSYEVLDGKGFPREAIVSELYASGEIGEVLLKAVQQGVFKAFRKNASPTCQFGIAQSRALGFFEGGRGPKDILRNIQDGSFADSLEAEARQGYGFLEGYDKMNAKKPMTKAFEEWRKGVDGSDE